MFTAKQKSFPEMVPPEHADYMSTEFHCKIQKKNNSNVCNTFNRLMNNKLLLRKTIKLCCFLGINHVLRMYHRQPASRKEKKERHCQASKSSSVQLSSVQFPWNFVPRQTSFLAIESNRYHLTHSKRRRRRGKKKKDDFPEKKT